MKTETPVRRRKRFFLTVDTELLIGVGWLRAVARARRVARAGHWPERPGP